MREIVCPICTGAAPEQIFAATLPGDFSEKLPPAPYSAHYQINRCSGCGLVYSSPIMEEEGVAALYRGSAETNVVSGEEHNVRRTMVGYYSLAAPYLASRNRILDVGCDMGFLLEAAANDGFTELHGIEPNPVARAVAQRLDNARVVDGFYETSDYPEENFDLIALIHVLDHLVDPRTVLDRAFRDLQPDGLILAVVHNVRSFLGRLLGERFPIYNLYHHFFFDRTTLAELFRRQGFDVIALVSTYNCYSLRFFAARLPACPRPLRHALIRTLDFVHLSHLSLAVPLGNIAIVARRRAASISEIP